MNFLPSRRRLLPVLFLVLALQAAHAGRFTFKENYTDTLLKFREDGETYYEESAKGTFSAVFRIPTAELNLDETPDDDLPIVISVGQWAFETTLGEATKVNIRTNRVVFRVDGGSVALRLKAGFLEVTVRARTGFNRAGDSFQDSPAADVYSGEPSMNITPADEQSLSIELSIGDMVTRAAEPFLSGRVTTREVVKGRGDDAESFTLSKIRLQAATELVAADED